MHTRTVRTLAVLLFLFSMSRGARAETTNAEREEAHRLASEGDDAFQGGRCDRAVTLWKQAESHFHAPTILYRIATCQKLLGHVVEATELLEKIVGEALPANAPTAFLEVQREAREELPNVRARVARLEVIVETSGGPPASPSIVVDESSTAGTRVAMPIDPGSHRIAVHAGDAAWEQLVTIGDGEQRTVRVALTAEAPARVVPTQRIVGYVLGGVGIAAMAVGAGFGYAAVQDSHALFDVCGPTGKHCPPEAQSRMDRLKTESLIADLAIGGGAAVFVAGAIVVLTSSPPRTESPRLHLAPMGLGAQVVGAF